jgi:AAA domain-containing protein/CHAT domain-containing protein
VKPIVYLDFDLQIERAGDVYRAQVLNSPAGNATHTFSLPFAPLELENYMLRLGATRQGVRGGRSPEAETAKSFGGRLFETVFDGEVQGCLRLSLDMAGQQGKGLRIRLRLTEAPDLLDLPWEYLYNQTLNLFYALSVETPLVRYLEMPERITPLGVAPPLRVLVMIASPKGYPPLNVEREWQKLRTAVRDLEERGLVLLERLEQATLPALRRQLRTNDYNLFHFVGHGDFDPHAQDGALIFEDEDGLGSRASAQSLSVLMRDYRHTLRLVILNACEGARTSGSDPFAGTAQRLIQQGIPAVIAMQFAVTDETAIAFAQEFYAALTDGFPVDAALTEARKAISAEAHGAEWGTPVLYMRAPDGQIFHVKSKKRGRLYDRDRPQKSVWQDRRFEAAMPKVAQVGRPTEVRAMIALADSEGLGRDLPAFTEHGDLIAKRDVRGRAVVLEFTAGRPQVNVHIELEAPGFQIDTPIEPLRVLHDRDSGVATFFLTPTQPGQRARVSLRLYQDATTRELIDTLTLYVDVVPSDAPTFTPSQAGVMWQIASAPLRASSPQPLEGAVERAVSGPPTPHMSTPTERPAPAPVPPPSPTAAVPPQLLEAPEGNVRLESPFYVPRTSDQVALRVIGQVGTTITIKGPRQIGKSSLLIRLADVARQAGKRIAFLDFQQFDRTALADDDLFFRQFCARLTYELGQENKIDEYWQWPFGNIMRCSDYVEEHLLARLNGPLVLAMDEVDRLFEAEFRSDFFGMLRSWHNERSANPIWRQLDLVLVTSTEPYQLIDNLNQSPFNVGEVIEIADFTPNQIADLNARHGSPLTSGEVERLIALVRGHPYLARKALYEVAIGHTSAAQLFQDATSDQSPFAIHLSHHFMRLQQKEELARGMLQVIRASACPDDRIFFRLHSAGLVRRERGAVVPRCQLYADYFRERLHV